MYKVKIDNSKFARDMDNIVNYSLGFLDGVKQGFPSFLQQLGATMTEALKAYIDANARVNPQILHHMYEWNKTGSPDSRLYDISYNVIGSGISFNSTFRQSNSIKDGSRVPFYDKARIMENGIPVTIVPKQRVLVFEEEGETVFTTKPVRVDNPGGQVQGEYQKVFDSFFNRYFTQSFLESSGIASYLRSPVDFKKNFSAGKRGGRARGVTVGKSWIAKAGLI
jgi:hypothetical protein